MFYAIVGFDTAAAVNPNGVTGGGWMRAGETVGRGCYAHRVASPQGLHTRGRTRYDGVTRTGR